MPADDLPTLAILAGGEGSRMGRPKGELRIGDQPILAYLLDRFAWKGPTLLVTAPGREHPPGAEQFDSEAVDLVPAQGPLRGVMTALRTITTSTVIITTIDMPAVGPSQFAWLIEQLESHREAIGFMMQRSEGRIEPFPSIFRRQAMNIVRAQLDAGQLSVQRMCSQSGFVVLPVPTDWDSIIWTNLNRPADVEAFMQKQ